MRSIRKAIFWTHLAIGLLAGALVLVMSVTGVLMAYERQITEWADSLDITKPAGKSAMTPERILSSLKGPVPSAITLDSDPEMPITFQFGREKTEFIDPYTGDSLGQGNTSVRGFFKFILGWHRWLGREGATQELGKSIIGIGNLMFLFLVISGVILWLPKRWSRSGVKLITLFQKRLKGRARDWNWHNVFGFWAAIPLLIVVTCGAVISQPWATGLVFRIAGESPPPAKNRKKGGPGGPVELPANIVGLDAALAVVQKANPEWRTIQLQLPFTKSVSFAVADSHRGRPDKRRTVNVDIASSSIVQTEGLADLGPGRRARTWIRWIHTGEAGGFAGQTIAGLAAAASAVLVWTGFALSWRRFNRKRTA